MAGLGNEHTEFTFLIQHVQLLEAGRFFVRLTIMTSPVSDQQKDIKVQKVGWIESEANSAMTDIFENNLPEEPCQIPDNTFVFALPLGLCRLCQGQFVYLLVEAYKVTAHSKSVEQLCKRVGFRRFIVHPRTEGKKTRSRLSRDGLYSLTSIMTLLHAPSSEDFHTYPTQIKFSASLKIVGQPAVSTLSLLTTPIPELPHIPRVMSISNDELPNVPLPSKCSFAQFRERLSVAEVHQKQSVMKTSISDQQQMRASFTEMSLGSQSKIPVYDQYRMNNQLSTYVNELQKVSLAKMSEQRMLSVQKKSSSLSKMPPRPEAKISASDQPPAQLQQATSATASEKVETPKISHSVSQQAAHQAAESVTEVHQIPLPTKSASEQNDVSEEAVSFTAVQPLSHTPPAPTKDTEDTTAKKKKRKKRNNTRKRTILDQLPVAFKSVPMGTEALIGAILPAILPALATVPSNRHISPVRPPVPGLTDGEDTPKQRGDLMVSTRNFFRSLKQVPSHSPTLTPVDMATQEPAAVDNTEAIRLRRHIQKLHDKVARLEAENEYLSYAGPDLSCGSGSTQPEVSLCEFSDGGSICET